ncbi:hypothetical protein ACJMK2_020528 [Sinanodonta woodiana]|uniref:PDZ domain-containing protein n=1 Tax=Sinanodonta woodiana TaxID=1069815 RepID=A0ABD3TZD9_SINWO
MANAYHPRLCHIRKWPDFQGYGFNLHAEKGRAGQYIGKVDDDSPAQAGGLREGDRIVEINNVNIGNENHQQVVSRIKAGYEGILDEVALLVVDPEADKYFKEEKIVVRNDMAEVVRMETPPRPGKEDLRTEENSRENHEYERQSMPEPEPEPEPEVHITAEYNKVETPRQSNVYPRLCHIIKWPDFNGYGFNLHADKENRQFIGQVDDDSPAEAAGLKMGDRIVEVNGVNIEEESHKEVIQRVKDGGNETRFLVVDKETDQYYKNNGIQVRGDLPEVKYIATPKKENNPYFPRLCHICKWPEFQGYGFNLHSDKSGQFIGKIDDGSPAEVAGLREGDRIIEVNGVNIESENNTQVITRIKEGGDETTLLVVDKAADNYYKSNNIIVKRDMPGVKHISSKRSMQGHEEKPEKRVNGEARQSEPLKMSPVTTETPRPVSTPDKNGGLNLNLSAKEMRERLAQRKKKDVKSNMDFRSKYEIFQKM